MIHPVVKILFFLLTLLLVNLLSHQQVWLLSLLLCVVAANLHVKSFLRAIKRMRWLFVSLFIIYVFGTPGEYMQQFPVNFSPTYEGCSLGLLQIAKLLIALAALSILFATSSKEVLIAGFYEILAPFQWLGLNVARFTTRLLLTLDYVEELAQNNQKTSFYQLDDLYLAIESLQPEKTIVLQTAPFNLLDKCMIVIFIVSALAMLLGMI